MKPKSNYRKTRIETKCFKKQGYGRKVFGLASRRSRRKKAGPSSQSASRYTRPIGVWLANVGTLWFQDGIYFCFQSNFFKFQDILIKIWIFLKHTGHIIGVVYLTPLVR